MKETSSAFRNAEARDEILASIRRGLKTSEPFDAIHNEHQGKNADTVPTAIPQYSGEELIENFRKNLGLVGGKFTYVSNLAEAASCIDAVIESLGAKRVAVTDLAMLSKIVTTKSGIDIVKNASADVLFRTDLGITGAQWAIAETGTLVLESEKESSRLTSLVPPIHLCVLPVSRIRQTLGEILELTGKDLSRTMTFITGASRTSDIELTLAIGVHGPGELHVIVIADQ